MPSSPSSSPSPPPPRPPPSRRRPRAASPHPTRARDSLPSAPAAPSSISTSTPKPRIPRPSPAIPPPLPPTRQSSSTSSSAAYVTALSRTGSASTATSGASPAQGSARLPAISEARKRVSGLPDAPPTTTKGPRMPIKASRLPSPPRTSSRALAKPAISPPRRAPVTNARVPSSSSSARQSKKPLTRPTRESKDLTPSNPAAQQQQPPTLLVQSPSTHLSTSPSPERRLRRKPAPASREGTPAPSPTPGNVGPEEEEESRSRSRPARIEIPPVSGASSDLDIALQGPPTPSRSRSTRSIGLGQEQAADDDAPRRARSRSRSGTVTAGTPTPVLPVLSSPAVVARSPVVVEPAYAVEDRSARTRSGAYAVEGPDGDDSSRRRETTRTGGRHDRDEVDRSGLAASPVPPALPPRSAAGYSFDERRARTMSGEIADASPIPPALPPRSPAFEDRRTRTRSGDIAEWERREERKERTPSEANVPGLTSPVTPPLPPRSPSAHSVEDRRARTKSGEVVNARSPVPPALPPRSPVPGSFDDRRERTKSIEVGDVMPVPPALPPRSPAPRSFEERRERTRSGDVVEAVRREERRERMRSGGSREEKQQQQPTTPGSPERIPFPTMAPYVAGAPNTSVAFEEKRARTRSGGYTADPAHGEEAAGRTRFRERTRSGGVYDREEIDFSRLPALPASPLPPPTPARAVLSRQDSKEERRERTRTWSAGLVHALGLGGHAEKAPKKEERRERTKSAAAVAPVVDSRKDGEGRRQARERTRSAGGVEALGATKRSRTRSAGHVLLGDHSPQQAPDYFNHQPPSPRPAHLSVQQPDRDSPSSSPRANPFPFDSPSASAPAPTTPGRTPRRSLRVVNPSAPSSSEEEEIARHRAEALAALSQPNTPRAAAGKSVMPGQWTPSKSMDGTPGKKVRERERAESQVVLEQRAEAMRSLMGGLGLGFRMGEESELTVTAVEESEESEGGLLLRDQEEEDQGPPPLPPRPATAAELRPPTNRFSQLFAALSGPYTPPLPSTSSPNIGGAEDDRSDYETEGSVWDESVDEEEGEIVWGGVVLDELEVQDGLEPAPVPAPVQAPMLEPPAVRGGLPTASSVSSLAWSGAEEVEKGFNAAAQMLFAGMQETVVEDQESGGEDEAEFDTTPRMEDREAMEGPHANIGQESEDRSAADDQRHAMPPPSDDVPPESIPALPRTWRSTLSSAAFASLSDRYGSLEMHRQELIWELTTTESAFVQSMRLVIRLFVQPLRIQPEKASRSHPPTWIPGVPPDVARLFDWLDDIVQLHSEIASALHSARASQYPVVLSCASLMLPLISKLEVHQPYLVRLEEVNRTIERMMKEPESDFGEFIRIQSGSEEWGGLGLTSWLLKPVQRLMKYPLFFKQLWESTPRGHADHLATFSLLHSTDTMIRIMQEVKGREEEYEVIKALASRMAGLPHDFQLAVRGRRLIAQGLLHRVEVGEREKAYLEGVEDEHEDRRRSRADVELADRMPPTQAYNPRFSAYSTTFSDTSSSEWPSTPASMFPPTPSVTSSSLAPDTPFYAYSPSPTAEHPNNQSRRSSWSRSPSLKRASRSKPRESPVYVFVFTDLVVFTAPVSDRSPLLRTPKAAESKKPEWKLFNGIGLARVLGVTNHSSKLGYDYLLGVEVLPIQDDRRWALDSSAAVTLHLTMPEQFQSRTLAPDALTQARQKWIESFERCFAFTIRSLSFPLSEPFSLALEEEIPDCVCGGMPKARDVTLPRSPSSFSRHDAGTVEHERGERNWWSHRFNLVAAEVRRAQGGRPSALSNLVSAKTRQRPESGDFRRRISGINQGETLPLMLASNANSATIARTDSRRSVMRLLSRKGR